MGTRKGMVQAPGSLTIFRRTVPITENSSATKDYMFLSEANDKDSVNQVNSRNVELNPIFPFWAWGSNLTF